MELNTKRTILQNNKKGCKAVYMQLPTIPDTIATTKLNDFSKLASCRLFFEAKKKLEVLISKYHKLCEPDPSLHMLQESTETHHASFLHQRKL